VIQTFPLASQTEAPFVGQAGQTYTFRVRATDNVSNPSSWAESAPVTVSAVRKNYFFGDVLVATRLGSEVYYVHGDHLGSVSLTTDASAAVVVETRYLPFGEERWANGTGVTDFTYTGQRSERGFGLLDYNARYYSPYLNRFISPDTVIPDFHNPQSLNRYTYVLGNSLRYNDPSGHQCAEGDMPCWEARWYRAHGYENIDKEWVYTGNYFFSDLESAYETIEDIALGRHFLPESANFTYNSFTFSLVQRGQDNTLSSFLGSVAFAMDIVDTSLTASFAALYTIEQVVMAAAGPGGIGAGFVVGEAAYQATGTYLTVVDLIGLGAVGISDLVADRTGTDLQNHQAYIGLDTLMSMTTMGVSAGAIYLVPVAPGVYIALGGDIIQLAYDLGRSAGFPGYSLRVQW